MKKCSRCKRLLNVSKFNKNKYNKNGLSYWCKECINFKNRLNYREKNRERHKKWRETNREKVNKRSKIYYEENKDRRKKYLEDNKQCILKQSKEYKEKNREYLLKKKREWYNKNKGKIREYHKKYREENQEHVTNQHKKDYENNKEKYQLRSKNYYNKNKNKIKKHNEKNKDKRNKQRRNRYCIDFKYKISIYISSSIRHSLKNGKKENHWKDLVNYTLDKLIKHLENQFTPKMNWNNLGKDYWSIDHIIPISYFNFKSFDDIEFKMCWNLNNLQPMEYKINCHVKNDKIDLQAVCNNKQTMTILKKLIKRRDPSIKRITDIKEACKKVGFHVM